MRFRGGLNERKGETQWVISERSSSPYFQEPCSSPARPMRKEVAAAAREAAQGVGPAEALVAAAREAAGRAVAARAPWAAAAPVAAVRAAVVLAPWAAAAPAAAVRAA